MYKAPRPITNYLVNVNRSPKFFTTQKKGDALEFTKRFLALACMKLKINFIAVGD